MSAAPDLRVVADPLAQLLQRPQVRAGAHALATGCARDGLTITREQRRLADGQKGGAVLTLALDTQRESRTMLRFYLLGAADHAGIDLTLTEARHLADQLEARAARGEL